MCGIAGIVRDKGPAVSPEALARMAAALRHRGPDGYGVYVGQRAGLAHVRLSIIDLECGAQPMASADGALVIVYNGEVYNYPELREELERSGRRFRTRSDTEVVLEAWRQWGPAALERFNGQFAFALLDTRDDSLVLARDRFGVRPLFLAERKGALIFASEVKGLLASGEVDAEPDPAGLDEVFTLWSARAPRTPFAGIAQLEPGCWARWSEGRLRTARWFDPGYAEAVREPSDALGTLDALLRSGVSLRLRADVPVGGYLSGGLDSAVACTLASQVSPHRLRTFSVAFDDPGLDERSHQETVAGSLRTLHLAKLISHADIAGVLRDVVRHAETPLVRTAPAPMMLLARAVRDAGIKVVLTGEGSDEVFLGYDLFKETVVRRFCLRRPGSAVRPRLLDRLYPYLAHGSRGGELWRRFFLTAGAADDPLFSHMPRILVGAFAREFYGAAVRDGLAGTDVLQELRDSLPQRFRGFSDLERAAYLELTTLLPGYLLSSQGDRMAMAHGVEGRFPFLDHRLFEFLAALPTRSRLRGLHEKDILRRWAREVVPGSVIERHKQPYRAPDAAAFAGGGGPDWVSELLSPEALRRASLFAPEAVRGLVRKVQQGRAAGFRENQAFVGILTAQAWHDSFIAGWQPPAPLSLEHADVILKAPIGGAVASTGAVG